MFLTQFEVNIARRQAQALLASPRRMHGAVEASFPPGDPEGRVLWRVDRYERRTLLYIVSPGRPDLMHLVEQAGWPTVQAAWRTASYTPVLDGLAVGQRYQFRLEANPTRSVPSRDGTRGKRVGHVTSSQQWQWFAERAQGWGIDVGGDRPTGAVVGRDVRSFPRDQGTVTFSSAVFEGELVVRDPQALHQVLVHGVGPSKAYGCGLMTLARAAVD